LAGCGSTGSSYTENPNASGLAGTTGHVDPNDGVPYIANGDPRMEEALKRPPPQAPPQAKPAHPSGPKVPPPTPEKPAQPPAPPANPELRLRLKEFEIARFGEKQTQPSRFGDDHLTLKIFFDGEPTVEFTAKISMSNNHFGIIAKASHYQISGTFDDISDLKTKGDLNLTDTDTRESAQILYEAYKGRLAVHTDREKAAAVGSAISAQFKDTYGWVHNWRVVRGRAFYLVDIVKVVKDSDKKVYVPPILAFKGESKRTGEQDLPAVSLTPDTSQEIELVGNSETGNRRWYQTKITDPVSKQDEEVILDVTDETQPEQAPPEEEEELEPSPSVPPGQTKPPKKTVQVEPVITDSAYLKIDTSRPRTARMTRDFNRNLNLPGVQKWIKRYSSKSDDHYVDLTSFYYYGNPFRPILEAAARAFDVSASYAYLTVIESRYLKSGNYRLEPINSAGAYGAFQFKPEAAREQGMRIDGGVDERAYFAPSACGAASYIGKLVNTFQDSDTTVAILGYYQGNGGAARAIYCTYQDRGECHGRNWSKYLKLSKNYSFKFADIERVAAIPNDQIDYVDQKLAMYFVSSNMEKYGMSIEAHSRVTKKPVPRTLPQNGSVWPSSEISNKTCREAMAELTGS
jgi:hypothetical protein